MLLSILLCHIYCNLNFDFAKKQNALVTNACKSHFHSRSLLSSIASSDQKSDMKGL